MNSNNRIKSTCASSLFSLIGPFDTTNQLSKESEDIRRIISSCVTSALKKHKIDINDMFLVGNISAFRYHGNALSFSAKKGKVDVFLQKTRNGEDIDLYAFCDLISDFATLFSIESNLNFKRLIFNTTEAITILDSEETEMVRGTFPFSNDVGNKYVGITTIDEESKQIVRVEDCRIVSTLSHGLLKEDDESKIALQLEITTNPQNNTNRFGKESIRKFLNYSLEKIGEKRNQFVGLLINNGQR